MERRRMQPWSAVQRRVLLALCLGMLIYLSVRLWLHPSYVSRPPPDEAPLAAELLSRIDPNTAAWNELAALPALGPGRARQIVEYRESARKRSPKAVVFRTPEDLQRVPGIGPAIAESLTPYLVITQDPSSDQALDRK